MPRGVQTTELIRIFCILIIFIRSFEEFLEIYCVLSAFLFAAQILSKARVYLNGMRFLNKSVLYLLA